MLRGMPDSIDIARASGIVIRKGQRTIVYLEHSSSMAVHVFFIVRSLYDVVNPTSSNDQNAVALHIEFHIILLVEQLYRIRF